MTIEEIEKRLVAAKARLDKILQSGEMGDDAYAANEEVLKFERELAAAKGEEYAVTIDCPRWDVGAPLPHLLQNDYKALLVYCVGDDDPDWDGSYVSVRDPAADAQENLVLVQFERVASTRFGDPNDEVLNGHRLYGRGQEGYRAQIVRNSRWKSELESVNRVHPRYDPQVWKDLSHYVFWFHDSTFECVAGSFGVERHRETFRALLVRAIERLYS
jgi:hypothetical protein